MSGAVGSPFTAAMFHFDGVSITNSNFIVNTIGDNKLRKVINLLVFMAIYFSLDRIGYEAGRGYDR